MDRHVLAIEFVAVGLRVEFLSAVEAVEVNLATTLESPDIIETYNWDILIKMRELRIFCLLCDRFEYHVCVCVCVCVCAKIILV